MAMKTMKLFLVFLVFSLAARGWVSCEASSRRLLIRRGETEGTGGGLLPFSRKLLSKSEEESNDMETELLLPDDMETEKVDDIAEKKGKASKSENEGSTHKEDLDAEKQKLENVKKKETEDGSIAIKEEEGDLLLEVTDEVEGVGQEKEESHVGGEWAEADSLAENKIFEGEAFQEEKGGIQGEKKVKIERQEGSASSLSDKALDTPTIELELMGEELPQESGDGDKGEAGSSAQQKGLVKLTEEKGQEPKGEKNSKNAKMEAEETASGKATDTPINLELQGEEEGLLRDIPAVDVVETETKTGALVSGEGGGSKVEKKSKKKKKKKSIDMESMDTKDVGEEKQTPKEISGEKSGGKLQNEEEINTDSKPSLEKQQVSSGQTKDKEKSTKGKSSKKKKTSKQPEPEEEVERKLTGDGETKTKHGKEEGLELVDGLDMAADEQVKTLDTGKSKAKGTKKKKVKKEEKLVGKDKKEKAKDVEKQSIDKGVEEWASPDSSLSSWGNMEAKDGKEATMPEMLEAVNVTSDGGGVTPQVEMTIAVKPSRESNDVANEQKPEEEEDDEYGDFMQDFTDLPSKFQDTAQKVAGHLGPNIQRITDTSKGYFNRANQQITESFSPLVGKQFAPFFASLVSYGLLLLPLAVVLVLFEHIRALLSLQKVLLFVNIYLAAYFATLLLATFIMGEPMNFFYKSSASGYVHLQLLQALGYIIYLILQTLDMVFSCASETLAVKVTVVLQWLVAFMIGFHYYVTVFHRAMAMRGPHTSWKIYGVYSIAFLVLCLFARIKRVKKGYSQLGQTDADKKN